MTLRAAIAEKYGDGFLNKSVLSIRDGGGVFEEILGGRAYRTALEIGTYRGVSAAEMSTYCDRVITIDLEHGKLEHGGEDFDRRAFWSSLGVTNVDLRLVRDDAHKAQVVAGLDFDFAFVDGAHDETVAFDFALVKRCGAVLFHDYCKRSGKRSYVYDFVNTLPKDQVQVIDIFAFWKRPQ